MALAWFHCFSGIAGDMALGALLDAGADVDEVRDVIARLPVSGWDLRAEVVQRAGLRATRAVVHAPEDPDHHRTFADLRGLLAGAGLPDRVRARALAVFTALAEAEGRLHGVPADAVHFHEVGALDAIVDVVGTCAALELLDVDERPHQSRHGRPRHGPGRPRRAAQPGPRVARPPGHGRHPDGRRRVTRRAGDPDRGRAAGRSGRGLRTAPTDDAGPHRLRRRRAGRGGPGQRRPGRDRHGVSGGGGWRSPVPGSRWSSWPPTSTTSRVRCSPTRWPRCSPPAPTTPGSPPSS